jgi:membrane protease YdiL (CAAX protease family)
LAVRIEFATLGRVQNANEPLANEPVLTDGKDTPVVYKPTPDDPPWNTPIALLVWFASVVAIILVPSVFVIPYIMSRGPGFNESQALGEFLRTDTTAIILQMLAVLPAHLLTLAIAWVIATKLNTFSFRETLGWRSGGMVWWHHVAILIAFFAIALVVGLYFPEQENELTRILRSSRTAVFIVAFMATFTAPLVEEVIYRGLVYSALQRTFGPVLGIVSVTLLFALVHVPQYYPSVSSISLLLLLSLVLTLVRAGTGNLLPCIVLHTIFNAIQSILLILEPYVKSLEPAVEPTTAFFLK